MLSQQWALKEFRYESANVGGVEELVKLRKSSGEAGIALGILREKQKSLTEDLASLESQWTEFRATTLRAHRQRMIGLEFPEFSSVSGKKYQAVKVASIDDAGVTIRHLEGAARLRFADLDAKQRWMFGLEEDLAATAQADEAVNSAEYDRWVDAQMASSRDTEQRQTFESAREDSIARRERQALVASQLAAADNRALARPASAVGSGSWGGDYSRYRTYRPRYRTTVWYYTPAYYPACRAPSVIRVNRMNPPGGIRPTTFANTVIKAIP